jgi:toxin HigB-1
MAIRSFTSKILQAYWERDRHKGIDPKSADRIKDLLSQLMAATKPEDMDIAGNDFHRVKGRRGRYAVAIPARWELTFGWESRDAVGVNEEEIE